MENNVDVVVAVGIAAAAAAIGVALVSPTKAYAENTAEYTSAFVSTLSRAEVRAGLMGSELLRSGSSEWAAQYNPPVVLKSAYTAVQARAEYRTARSEVLAVGGEDSGSAYFKRKASNAKAVMGGPAVDPSNVERDL